MNHSDEEIKDIVMKCDIKSEKIIHRRKAIKTFFILLIVLSPIWIAAVIKYSPIVNAWLKAEIYVHQNYGYEYRCVSIKPYYSRSMPFSNYLNFVEVIFSDKSEQLTFSITIRESKIIQDTYNKEKDNTTNILAYDYEFFETRYNIYHPIK